MNILVSACLLGVNCRYDGTGMLREDLRKAMDQFHFIPVCPEQLGGLMTPRDSAERVGSKIITKTGEDVTGNFIQGAKEVLNLANIYQCKYAILKERSPSCGHGRIYDGTFSGTFIEGDGIATEMLQQQGITVIGENEIGKFLEPFIFYSL